MAPSLTMFGAQQTMPAAITATGSPRSDPAPSTDVHAPIVRLELVVSPGPTPGPSRIRVRLPDDACDVDAMGRIVVAIVQVQDRFEVTLRLLDRRTGRAQPEVLVDDLVGLGLGSPRWLWIGDEMSSDIVRRHLWVTGRTIHVDTALDVQPRTSNPATIHGPQTLTGTVTCP